MTFAHGRKTAVKLNGTALTVYVTTSQVEKNSDKHDVTTYGKDAHVFNGGLLNGAFTMSGIYDNTAVSGPRALIQPLIGTNVTLVHYPEGIGSGKPMDTLTVLVEKYVQTHPVADMVTWSCDCQPSDTIDSTPQP
jgi:hypothetical protein